MKPLLLFAAASCTVVGVSALVPGMFTGPHILIPAILLIAVGILLWIPIIRGFEIPP